MSDWRFGDVLRYARRDGHDTIIMFIARKDPAVWTGTAPEFWGFTGLYLPTRCAPSVLRACSHGDFDWSLGAFGGHPEAPHNQWVFA